MRTLTFEQLRINLTLTFDALDEPVQIVKKGKVRGYIVKELPAKVQEKAEYKDNPETTGDTVYEPDPIKLVKNRKEPVSRVVVPMVAAMLSGVKREPTVSHHPRCKCEVCKI